MQFKVKGGKINLRKIMFALVIAAAFYPCLCSAEQVKPGLWKRAVRVADSNNEWIPGRVRIADKTWDEDGNLEESSETVLAIDAFPVCEFNTRVLKALKNGKCIKEQVEKDDGSLNEMLEDEEENPFLSSMQQKVVVNPLNKKRTIGSRKCSGFSYVLSNSKNEMFKGVAWIDDDWGAPLEISYEASSVPIKTEAFTIIEASVVQAYEYGPDHAWRMTEKTSMLKIDARPFPLVRFKGKVQILEEYSDHWRYKAVRPGEQ